LSGTVKVFGKGSAERICPSATFVCPRVKKYIDLRRQTGRLQNKFSDVFEQIWKQNFFQRSEKSFAGWSVKAGLSKKISPHYAEDTFARITDEDATLDACRKCSDI
jgi:site-specific recombinase XerC